jgi:pimeloyl-ACP methyl ester carboxylesterase
MLAAAPVFAAADGTVAEHSLPSSPLYIVVGFVGGFVRHDNPHQGPVLFAQRAQRSLPKNSYVHVFENRHRKSAYKTILQLLDSNRDGYLNSAEKAQARIILFGHSWGGSAVVMLARELDRAGIPVLLTVQVDSVAKPWQHDGTIPDNVAAAANFYQPNGFVHGRAQITAADKAKTQILGNYRFNYQQAPVKCEARSWFDHLTPTHAESACDPHLWSQIEDLVRARIEPDSGTVAAIRQR